MAVLSKGAHGVNKVDLYIAYEVGERGETDESENEDN